MVPIGPVWASHRPLTTPHDWSYDVPKPERHPHGAVLYPKRHLTESVGYTYCFTLFCGHNESITSRTHVTTALQECDFVRTFHGPQFPTSPQVYEPETTRRSHVTLTLDVLCLGHMNLPGSSGPVGNHAACHVGPHKVSKMFGPVRAPYFHTRTVFLRFCAGRTLVDCLAGTMLVPSSQMAHNQFLPGKYNAKVASPDPVRPGTTDHTDIPTPVYGIRTVSAYLIEFPSPYEIHRNPYGATEPFRVCIRYLAIMLSKNMQRTHRTPVCL